MNSGKRCELCGRQVALTRHHLIPKTHHRNKRFKKTFTKDEMRADLLWVCRPCHSHIHACFSERQLGLELNSREALLAQPEIQKFVEWIKNKEPGFKPKQKRRYW